MKTLAGAMVPSIVLLQSPCSGDHQLHWDWHIKLEASVAKSSVVVLASFFSMGGFEADLALAPFTSASVKVSASSS